MQGVLVAQRGAVLRRVERGGAGGEREGERAWKGGEPESERDGGAEGRARLRAPPPHHPNSTPLSLLPRVQREALAGEGAEERSPREARLYDRRLLQVRFGWGDARKRARALGCRGGCLTCAIKRTQARTHTRLHTHTPAWLQERLAYLRRVRARGDVAEMMFALRTDLLRNLGNMTNA